MFVTETMEEELDFMVRHHEIDKHIKFHKEQTKK